MKKHVLAMMVTAIAAGSMMSSAFADTATVSGGTVNFVGQVVNAACSVSADSVDQTVTLSQVRASKLTDAGMTANQKEDFSIKLEDCDTTVSQQAAVIFNGQQDSMLEGTLANFKARVGERALLTLLHGGQPVPFGATASTDAPAQEAIVGDDGEVYLSGLSPQGTLKVQWGREASQQCLVHYQLPATRQALVRQHVECR